MQQTAVSVKDGLFLQNLHQNPETIQCNEQKVKHEWDYTVTVYINGDKCAEIAPT